MGVWNPERKIVEVSLEKVKLYCYIIDVCVIYC